MKFLLRTFIIAIVLSLLYQVAFAGDYVANAVEALQHSSVYVAPGTPGTDQDTPNQLGVYLEPNGNIVLIMLPPEALTGTDILSIARKISEGLNNEKIIGLAVGDNLIGYSTLLPSDLVTGFMSNARSVSNSPVTALFTFSRNVNLWLIQHPQPSPTPRPTPVPTPRPTLKPIKLPKASEIPVPVWAISGVFFLAVVVAFFISAAKTAKKNKRLKMFAPIKLLIDAIHESVLQIKDRRIHDELLSACQAAYGVLEILEQSPLSLGYVEAKFPVLLSNMDRQTRAFIRHESGRRPLPHDLLVQLKEVLLNYDSLFIKLQENDPEGVDLLASVMDSNTTMISTMGYLPEEDDK